SISRFLDRRPSQTDDREVWDALRELSFDFDQMRVDTDERGRSYERDHAAPPSNRDASSRLTRSVDIRVRVRPIFEPRPIFGRTKRSIDFLFFVRRALF